ncbi:hypothetical protein FXW78_45790 [Rhodococcus opacus]|nr:hypothetical protein [Rhodococcus opacus]
MRTGKGRRSCAKGRTIGPRSRLIAPMLATGAPPDNAEQRWSTGDVPQGHRCRRRAPSSPTTGRFPTHSIPTCPECDSPRRPGAESARCRERADRVSSGVGHTTRPCLADNFRRNQ